jgi:hypothetical protein
VYVCVRDLAMLRLIGSAPSDMCFLFCLAAAFVDQIYLYAGLAVDNKHETGFIAKEIRKHNYRESMNYFAMFLDLPVTCPQEKTFFTKPHLA